MQNFFMRILNTLIRLRGCAGWFGSSLVFTEVTDRIYHKHCDSLGPDRNGYKCIEMDVKFHFYLTLHQIVQLTFLIGSEGQSL